MMVALILIGLLVLVVIILGLVAPQNYHVSRSVMIEKPESKVFPYVQFLQKQDEWSPWARRDSEMFKEIRGEDGTVGAVSYWKGNKKVGEGEHELTNIVANELVQSHLRFIRPWASESDAYLRLEEAGGQTRVTWGFSGVNPFPFNIMMLFMNMDKMIGKDFEEGLSNLKKLIEEQAYI